jgi:hypothetical protein
MAAAVFGRAPLSGVFRSKTGGRLIANPAEPQPNLNIIKKDEHPTLNMEAKTIENNQMNSSDFMMSNRPPQGTRFVYFVQNSMLDVRCSMFAFNG